MTLSTKPTPNPRGYRPLEGVGFRMGWLAHALPTETRDNHGKGVSGRGESPTPPLIPDHAGRKPRPEQPRTAMPYRVSVGVNGPRLGAIPAPTSAARVSSPASSPERNTA